MAALPPLARAPAPASPLYGAVAGRRMTARGRARGRAGDLRRQLHGRRRGQDPDRPGDRADAAEAGERPVFLSRGYGGRLPGRCGSSPAAHGAPRSATSRSCSRAFGPGHRLARPPGRARGSPSQQGASVIVMDDGLQNPVARQGFGDRRRRRRNRHRQRPVLPAGPLRAPMAAQWPRIDGAS